MQTGIDGCRSMANKNFIIAHIVPTAMLAGLYIYSCA